MFVHNSNIVHQTLTEATQWSLIRTQPSQWYKYGTHFHAKVLVPLLKTITISETIVFTELQLMPLQTDM